MTDRATEKAALALLADALDQPFDQREAWLAARSDVSAAVLARVRDLMAADALADSSLRTGGAAGDSGPTELPERIGGYRIRSLIGQGGMGAVYRGERATGDFEHEAAIKVVRPGPMAASLAERFRHERQILARLDHPGIARLFDGGETEAGEPYFVMEYVEGRTLKTLLDERAMDLEGFLDIHNQACRAVRHAHGKLIVHGDISPANILVKENGEAKLIDFGISRMSQADDGTISTTQNKEAVFTRAYAAPERRAGQPASTVADIYALGVMLSDIVEAAGGDAELRAIAARSSAENPEARYSSVEALISDLDRRSGGFPVEAMGGGAGYRTRKLVGRHRLLFGAIATGAVGLLIALTIVTALYRQAETARAAEASRFSELRSLANYMLFDLNDRLERVVGNTEARIALSRRAQQYLARLAMSPSADDRLKLETAEGFIKLARIQGVPTEPNFGATASARANLERAEEILLSIDGGAGAEVAPTLARARAYRGLIHLHSEANAGAAREAVAQAVRGLGDTPRGSRAEAWHSARSVVRKAQAEIADLGNQREELGRLAVLLESEVDQWPRQMRQSRAAAYDRAYAAYLRALHRSLGEPPEVAESIPLFLEADRRFADLEASLRNDPAVLYLRAWNAYNGFAAASRAEEDTEARRLLEQARTTIDRLLEIEEADRSLRSFAQNVREAQSQQLRDLGRFREAIELQRQVVAEREASLSREASSSNMNDVAFGHVILATIARDASDRELSCASMRRAEWAMGRLAQRGELHGYVGRFREGVRANLQKCAQGQPTSAFGRMS